LTTVRSLRLDQLLVERGLAPSRTRAQALIMAGRVRRDGRRLDKPGAKVAVDIELEVDPGERYVSRGARKLAGALKQFQVETDGLDAMDVGASTGGFTQILLESGATRVIALDVGKGQIDWSLRSDARVIVMEGVNARHLKPSDLPFRPAVITMDVSFISIEKILPALAGCIVPGGRLVSLIKPQFEVGKGKVGKGGIVRNPALHREVLERICSYVLENRWGIDDLAVSSIRGAEGNVEFFICLTAGSSSTGTDIENRIDELLNSVEESP
jgi:23S rRNA (cytidine1920-2'-O)/16S rRNA (cytidine1409-2'-O)-methyltransferase